MLWERLEKSQDGKELTIVRPNEDVLKALQNIGDEDPAIVLDWDISALNAATAHVNAMGAGVRPAIPTWIGGSYPVSAQALQEGIAAYLALSGGGREGNSLIAPNTLIQFGTVSSKIGAMMTDPFVVTACTPANCRPLARIFIMADGKRSTTGESAPPPHPHHGVIAFE